MKVHVYEAGVVSGREAPEISMEAETVEDIRVLKKIESRYKTMGIGLDHCGLLNHVRVGLEHKKVGE